MPESILRILALIRKELLAILRDPRSRVSLFLPPIVQCLIFGYAATYDLTRVPSSSNQDWAAPDPRHQGLTNVTFLDGHAKSMKRTSAMTVVGGNWNGKAPNKLHWDAQFH